MRKIKRLDEISYTEQEAVEFEATVLDVNIEGNEELKRPMKFALKLEESGENVSVISWAYVLLPNLKEAVKSTDIFLFESMTGTFSNGQKQIRIGNMRPLNKKSEKKIIKTVDILDIKRDIQSLINTYITTKQIKDMLQEMILNNEKFFQWPAATKMHHAYEGGLAEHSLSVCKNAVMIWERYQGLNLDIEVLVASALLHDIGKLDEYNKDGGRTKYGNLISHLVSGAERVFEYCYRNGIDSNTSAKFLLIKHSLLSHHEKPEFGAAVQPATLEAFIVARADALDASYDIINKEINNISSGEMTNNIFGVDNMKFLKWK
jgi:putative nucleotidyltransferase with HDIG domain